MEEDKYFLSIDLGTQGTKAAIVNLDGEVIGTAFADNVFVTDDDGKVALDGEVLKNDVAKVTREVIKKTGIDAKNIAGIGTVGMMAGTIGIGDNWEPIIEYDTGNDKRCEKYITKMQEIGGKDIVALSGTPVIDVTGPKMLWWRAEHPETFAKIKKFVTVAGYICGCMAGLKAEDAYVDYTTVHFHYFGDLRTNEWSDEMLARFDFPKEKLPKIIAPYDVVGGVSKEWAEKTGLIEGTPVVAGCGDTAASLFGAGLTEKNKVLDIAGTASVIAVCVEEFKPDTEKQIIIYPRSVVDGQWLPFGFVLGGQAMTWYENQIDYDGNLSFSSLCKEADEVDSGDLFFIPFLAGRICPSDARFTGHWIGMKFNHTRAHMFKSIMESVAYEYRFYLDRLKELVPGLSYDSIITSAGGSKSREFVQIKANILNKPVTILSQKDTSHKTAAILAGYGVGIYKDLGETAKKMTNGSYGETLYPQPEKAAEYNDKYKKYLKLIDIIGDDYTELDKEEF